MTSTRAVIALVVLVFAATLTSCDGDPDATGSPRSTTSPAPTPTLTPTGPVALTSGKSDQALTAGSYASPEGFAPLLVMDVPRGWTSVHRGSDAFDLGRPDPTRDAPLVAVVVITPHEATAKSALAAIRGRANGTVTPLTGVIGTTPARGLDIAGGTGELVASAHGGIALDAAPGQRVRVLGADVDGVPLLVVVLVPDGDSWKPAWRQAARLLSGFTTG